MDIERHPEDLADKENVKSFQNRAKIPEVPNYESVKTGKQHKKNQKKKNTEAQEHVQQVIDKDIFPTGAGTEQYGEDQKANLIDDEAIEQAAVVVDKAKELAKNAYDSTVAGATKAYNLAKEGVRETYDTILTPTKDKINNSNYKKAEQDIKDNEEHHRTAGEIVGDNAKYLIDGTTEYVKGVYDAVTYPIEQERQKQMPMGEYVKNTPNKPQTTGEYVGDKAQAIIDGTLELVMGKAEEGEGEVGNAKSSKLDEKSEQMLRSAQSAYNESLQAAQSAFDEAKAKALEAYNKATGRDTIPNSGHQVRNEAREEERESENVLMRTLENAKDTMTDLFEEMKEEAQNVYEYITGSDAQIAYDQAVEEAQRIFDEAKMKAKRAYDKVRFEVENPTSSSTLRNEAEGSATLGNRHLSQEERESIEEDILLSM